MRALRCAEVAAPPGRLDFIMSGFPKSIVRGPFSVPPTIRSMFWLFGAGYEQRGAHGEAPLKMICVSE